MQVTISLQFQDLDVCTHTSVLFYGLLSRLNHVHKLIVHSRGKRREGGDYERGSYTRPPSALFEITPSSQSDLTKFQQAVSQ
jgi:hypothetical protein